MKTSFKKRQGKNTGSTGNLKANLNTGDSHFFLSFAALLTLFFYA